MQKKQLKFLKKKKEEKCSSEKIDNSLKIVSLFFYKEGISVPVYTFEGKNELSRHTWEGKSAAKLVEWKYDEFYRLERNFEGV